MLTKYPSCFKYDAPGISNNLKAKEFPPPPPSVVLGNITIATAPTSLTAQTGSLTLHIHPTSENTGQEALK